MSQVRLIQLQVFAAIEEANAGVAPERRVTPKSALTVVKRSLNSTRNLPFEVREFHAMRELSAFISLVQKNNFSDTFTNHTDLLTSAHPSSTRTHGLSASALSKARLRWILSDSRISEQARPLLASMFMSPKTSAEYKYAEVRLSTLPKGSYPLEALTAAFGDGNSFIARRARALLQKRDRKGRFAYQGGGASALVERENGQVERLTGRVVSQSENGETVRIQLPNGRLVDIPTDGAEFIKAVIGKNKDGFSGTKANYKAGDIILNEEDLEFFDAPHGFRKDESYAGPGTKYTDDEYDVVREANSFKISRREDGKSVGSAKNWADAQKAIFDDEPVADKEAGREPIARLDQEQIDRMYDDPNFDPKDILTPEGISFDEGAGQDETSETGDFKYNYPEGAYQLPLDVKYADGFADPANDSDDFTDDPAELAQKFSSEALVNALRKGLLPGDGSKANGEGVLQFERKEPLPVEALYLALEEKGENARLEVAKIYDGANGDKKNQEALARLEGAPAPKAVIAPKAATPKIATPSLKGTNLTDGKGQVTWVSADELDRAAMDDAAKRGQIGMRPATRGEYRPVDPNNPDDVAAAKKATEAAPDGPFPFGGFITAGDLSPELKGWSKVSAAPSSELEEQPTEPPAAPMRRGQVSPGGDWQWYPPVRMGGNQQAKGFWGRTEKGIAKLPPKEVKTPPVASEPVLPDEIGGGWEPAIDTQGGKNAPMYKKTIDGSNFVFVQEEGGWTPLRVVDGERRLLNKYDNEDIVQNADADDFENKVAFIQDNMQKAYRDGLKTDLKINNFDEKVIDLVQDGKADEIIAAIKADPAYKELEDKYQDYLNDQGGRPGVMKAVVALGKINENLDQIRDFKNSAAPTNEPDVADAVTDVRGGIPTSSEIQAMLDGEGIGSEDEISGDAPSEVLPRAKAVLEEKQEQDPEKQNDILDELDIFADRANKASELAGQLLDNPDLNEGMDTNRVLSAGESVNLAGDMLAEAMVNVGDPSVLDNNIQQAAWYLTQAIATLADVDFPEAQGVRSEILELRNELETYRGKLEAELKVLPKTLKEEKAVNVPADIQKVAAELDNMEKAIKYALEDLALFQGEQNRVISAQLALFVARETLDKAILNLNSKIEFVRLMDEAIGHIGSAVESLTSDELRMPEILEIKDSLKKLQQQFADAKFKTLENMPRYEIFIDDVVENMLLGGESEIAVEDLAPKNEYTDVSPEAYKALVDKLKGAGFYGIQINDFNFINENGDISVYYDRDGDPEMRRRVATIISDGGAEALGIDWPTDELFNEFSEKLRDAVENINLKEETPEVPAEAPVEAPATGRGRRGRNNNVAANRRWQARFGIKPPVFYKKNRGMFYDINGVPVNVGDKVTHNNPDKDEKYGEGVIVSRIPNLGRWRIGRAGEQVKVDYASYVRVRFANGKTAKLATRMLINKNPDAVENPANVVKPVLDAEMPPPDVFIDDWKKFGKALEEFGVEPGKDARGNNGFQADAGNAQQMVISKDADDNYAVYLKEENIWLNRQVEPLFVTKSLPEAANYFIAEVHNRRYQTDFPANPVWAGDKAPSAVPNPETNVVEVPEAGSVNNAGMPNAVNLDTDVDFEDLQKQIQDAIDNGQKIVFNYKGEDRLVTPKRIWTNPKNGNINLDAVGEDGFKVYTIVNMENPNNPVEATPIPEVVIPEDVAPQVEDKPFLEDVSLEAQQDDAKKDFEDLGNKIVEKAEDGVGASDPEVAELYRLRDEAFNRIIDISKQIKQRNAAPEVGEVAPQAPEAEGPISEDNSSNFSPSDFEGDLGWSEGPSGMATNENGEIVDYARNAGWFAVVRDSAGVSKSLGWFRSRKEAVAAAKQNRKVDASKPAEIPQAEDAARAKQFEDIIAEFNETPENAQQDFEIINNDGESITVFDSRTGRQFEISWDKNANIWASNPVGFERNVDRKFFPSLNEAVDTAVTDLSNEREDKQGHNVEDFKKFVEDLKGRQFTRGSVQDQYDVSNFDEEGIVYIKDSENNNQANIVWDEDLLGYRIEFRPRELAKEEVYRNINIAGEYALEVLDNDRNKPEAEIDTPVIEKDEAPVGGGDAFDRLDDGNAIADLLGELAATLPKFRNTRGEKNARWARRNIDDAAAEFRSRPLDRAGVSEIRQALSFAKKIPDEALRDSIVSQLERLNTNLNTKREELKQERIKALNNRYNVPLPEGLVPENVEDLNEDNALAILKEFLGRLPEKGNGDIDRKGDAARQYLELAIGELESKEPNKKFQGYYHLKSAFSNLNDSIFNENQKVLASELEKLKNIYEQKDGLNKIKEKQEMYDRLALPIDDANWPTESNIDRDKVIAAVDELIARLPKSTDYEADEFLRNAAGRLNSYRRELVDENKDIADADNDKLDSALRSLKNVPLFDAGQLAFVDRVENLASMVEAKKKELRDKRLEDYKKNLAAPFAEGVIPENGDGVSRDQLIALFEDLANRLPDPENRDFNRDMRRAGEYARNALASVQRIEEGNPEPGIRNFDTDYLSRIITNIKDNGDKDEQALVPQLEKVKSAITEKKNSLNADIRNRYLARRDVPIPEDALPDEEKEGKQDFLDAVNQVFNRLPVDTDEEANTSVISAREILEKYIDQLKSNDDPFVANTRHLVDAAEYILGNTSDEKYAELADFLNNIADYAVGRRLERPVPELAPANMDIINPDELAKKRIEAKENPYTSPETFKKLFADNNLFDNNSYLKPFQEQIQKFFDGNEHPLSDLDIRARQALSQWVSSQLHNPPRDMDLEAVENVHNLVSLMSKLDNEKMAYEPNRDDLGPAGRRLLEIDPDDLFMAARNIDENQELVINGVATGFRIKGLDQGLAANVYGTNVIAIDIATGQKFIFKKEKYASQVKAEQEVAAIASGLGIHGRVFSVVHPLNDRVVVQTFAGDTNRKAGDVQLYQEFMVDSGWNQVLDENVVKQVNIKNAIVMNILDAIVNNTDRHRQNFMMADVDALGVADNGHENLYIFPIDHGYAAAINGGATSSPKNAKKFLLAKADPHSDGREGGILAQAVAKNIGPVAYKDILDMSLQQLEQYLNRLGGGEISQATLNTIMSRMADLRGISLPELERWIGNM
jgi:hypothetical protein